MGVDIQTYRGRIGCFSRNLGTDVITVQYIVDFTRGLKTIGTVVFIGILLLLAGIEQNPGPISESTSKRTPANATILKVCGLPTSIGTDSLISIFENTRRQGGGNVLRVDIDKNDSSALVEFEEAEALQLVLRKRPIQIDGKDVSVEIYIDEGSMDENNSSQTDGSDEVFADKPSDQQFGSDSEDVNMSGAVAKMVSTLQRSVTEGFRKGVGFIKSSAIFGLQENIVAIETESAEQLQEEEEPSQTKEDTGSLNIAPAVRVSEGAVALQPTEDTVALETESAKQLLEAAEPLLSTEDTVAKAIKSAARIPERAEPLQPTEETALKMECAVTNQEEAEPLKTPEKNVALEGESAEQLLEEEEPLQTSEDTGSVNIESAVRVSEGSVSLQPSENTEAVETEYAEQLLEGVELLLTTGTTVALETKSAEQLLEEVEPLQKTEDTVILETESAEQLLEEAEPQQTTEDTVAQDIKQSARILEGAEPLQSTENTVALETESAEQLLEEGERLRTAGDTVAIETESAKKILEETETLQTKASFKIEGQIFEQILQRLGLKDKFPGRISMQDIIAVGQNESVEQIDETISLTDIPWLILKRLMCAHSESRDITVTVEENSETGLNFEDSLFFFPEIPEDNQDISPMDILTVVFQCCDPFMKQIFVQKLYLCKLAVPFLYRYWETFENSTPILSIWPLRFLAIENKSNSVKEIQGRECDVLELPTKVLAFGRIGCPRYSKSKLINSLLLSDGCKTFFNIDCPSGMTPRQISNGQIEMFWLPTICERKDRFQDTMTFLNFRGDLCQHFNKELLSLIANFIDSIVFIIDLDTILKRSKIVKNVLLQFRSVILIIADTIKQDSFRLIRQFQKDVLSSKSNINLRILSTHKGTIEQNVVDMLSSVTKHISDQLKTNKVMSFEDRLLHAKLATMKTDEEDQVCQQGQEEALKLIKQMKTESDPSCWKQHLTPVHSKYSKQLGKLLKERERERNFVEGQKIDKQLIAVRRQQIASITKTVKCFLYVLIKHNKCSLILKYFLFWLHFYIEREKRHILPRLMHTNMCAWEKLKSLKSAEKKVKDEIEKQETVITDLEEKLDEASFTVQHFFREIGHINEAILVLKEDTSKLGLPNVDQISNIISRFVADGHPFELIDGKSFYMPYRWIKTVLQKVNVCIKSSKVMTLSVLGLQSSGKSTLLNTMFGSQFSSRTGKCTRGIQLQLIPTKNKRSSMFSYVLIVDTEGLRSPELSHSQHDHDNELATIITGVGDVTMLNIMGENTSEIRDVLQVIVHAFLRLKMTNRKLDMRKSCAFIHQNVTDLSARENMMSGLSKLMQTLDEMTELSARNEGILDITTFNQVIEFDIKSQVWYLKNLWQGNPPMARVNTEYSESAVDIKCKILNKALAMKNKSYKSLNDIVEQAHSLWKGVLNEDFVFSFRNSLEIKAYMEMEGVVQAELWRLESLIRDKLVQISQNNFATCNQMDNLRNVADDLITKLKDLLFRERIKTEEIIQTYFDGNKYKDVIIQWRNNQQTRVNILCEKLQQIINEHVKKSQSKRSLVIWTVTCHGKHEEELRNRSMSVVNAHRGKKLSCEKIDQLFGEIWKEFLMKVDTNSTDVERKRRKIQTIFQTCLEDIFKCNHGMLTKKLKKTNFLASLSNVNQLAKSFGQTKIKTSDISVSIIQKGLSFLTWSDPMKYVEIRVCQIFESVDGKIKELCQVNDEVTEMTINKLMHELYSSLQAIMTGESNCEFTVKFYLKILVHVSRYAHPIFESHNEQYFKTHGSAALLEQYRVQQKISFESHLRCRQFEDLIAELFSHVIETFAEECTIQQLPYKVTEELLSVLPNLKDKVIIEICTDLLQKGDFENFKRYIVGPYEYASIWITRKANQCLDDPEFQIIASSSSSLLRNMFRKVTSCVQTVKKEYQTKSPPSIDTWIESFQNKMKLSGCSIPAERFRNVKQETSSIQNVEYLTSTIVDHLKNSEMKLNSNFKSQKSHSMTWADFNPVSRVIKKIWGCQEQCPFCGEPCAKSKDHSGSSHYSIQHRPSCCTGIRNSVTQKAFLSSCNFDIQSDFTHFCSVFNNLCDVEKKGCGKIHSYRDYKTTLPNWDIAPTSNMHDSSEYWMWFVATYKNQLKKHFNYKIDHIPSSWENISKVEAAESLYKLYSA